MAKRSVQEIKAEAKKMNEHFRHLDRMYEVVKASSDSEKWCTHCWVRVYGKNCPKCHEQITLEYKQSALIALNYQRGEEDLVFGSLNGELEAALEFC